MRNLRTQIEDKASEIVSDVDHGECFYDLEMLNDFCKNLDELREMALAYYDWNKKEEE